VTRLAADDGAALAARLEQAGITEIRVVSPHLDDAAFSLAAFLARPGFPPRIVLTVFTRAGPMTHPDHALAMGFADAEAEFLGRRDEDMAAMRRLGTGFVHCGLESGNLDADSADAMIHGVLAGLELGQTLVLLPLGAGRVLSGLARFGRRVLRMPPGCGVHGDHVWVRDHLRRAIGPTLAQVGFYAEIPYQWANTPAELAAQARLLAAGPVDVFALEPDRDAKLAIVQDYRSQFVAEFGRGLRYRRRTASIAERIFMPAPTARTA
jgi:LmbE family N-acetylglucosaminyl deacetylase